MLFSSSLLPLRRLFVFLCLFFLSVPFAHAAFDGDANDTAKEEALGEKIAPDLEKTLTGLLAALSPDAPLPAEADLIRLARFMMSSESAAVRPAVRAEGEGAFMRRALRVPFPKLVRYCFDPSIPTEVLYPTVLRRGFWRPESDLNRDKTALWEHLAAGKSVTLRGTEYEEITPDTFSGCYYHYDLRRLIVLMRIDGKAVLFSVSHQPSVSSAGYKGAVVGRDSDWNYVYTKVTGSNLRLVGWAETYMYGSANIALMYENGAESALAFFKWVKAGWSNLNMVKLRHILAGGGRFLDGMAQVLEAPGLPAPEEIRARREALAAMDETQLRAAFAPHAALLAAGSDGVLSNRDFQDVLKDGGYPATLGREALISELMKLYMKERLGMTAAERRP